MKYIVPLVCAAAMLAGCHNTQAPHQRMVSQVNGADIAYTNGLQKAQLELAVTDAQHAVGLMNRPELATDAGMLFVFSGNQSTCFWMKNTLIPLTIGFVDEQGILQQTIDMQPQSLEARCPNKPFRYAIEMNQGWFARNNIQPNSVILHIKKAP